MLDDDPELEEAMAALPLEQLEASFMQQRPAPPPSVLPTTVNDALAFPPAANRLALTTATSPHSHSASQSILLPLSRTSLFPTSISPQTAPLPAASSRSPPVHPVPTINPPSLALPLSALLSEWRHLLSVWRCGSTSLLNDPYEVCYAIVKQLQHNIGDEQITAAAAAATPNTHNTTAPPPEPTETQKQLCGIYGQLMTLLDLPSSPFIPCSPSSLRSPPPYEAELLQHLACIAYNTAIGVGNCHTFWSIASYFCHFALQLFSLADTPLPDAPDFTSLSVYAIALLDEVAGRETADAHAVYGEAMLRILDNKRARDATHNNNNAPHTTQTTPDTSLTHMLDMQARMYVASGRRHWAEEEAKREKTKQKKHKKDKNNKKKRRKLTQQQPTPDWAKITQDEMGDTLQRLTTLLATQSLSVKKCEQLLAVAFHLRLDVLKRPLVEYMLSHSGGGSGNGGGVEWMLHYVELLCMLSSDEELFVFASSALSGSSSSSSTGTSSVVSTLHFRCWQFMCERCWTAGIVLVRGGASELGERLLAVGIRLLERACQCDASEKVGSQMNEQQVMEQLQDILAYVRERDREQQTASNDTLPVLTAL